MQLSKISLMGEIKMFKSRFTPEQKLQILKDFDSKRYTTEDLLKKYNITLQTLYNWRYKFNKRARNHNKRQIMEILDECMKIGVQATCAKYSLKPSIIYMWRSKYLRPEQQNKSTIDNNVTENKVVIEKVINETEDELAKYKEMCLALTFENLTLKNMLEKMKKQLPYQKNY